MMKTATAEDEGLPIVFLDIDDVLCLNNPYGGYDALEAVNGTHADPDTVLFAGPNRRQSSGADSSNKSASS